jgi:F-type H+-transporting ATPase subunit b
MDDGMLQVGTAMVEAVKSVPVHEAAADLTTVSGSLTILTWVTFLLVALILYKVAWKPVMAALEQRERSIRRSLADAEAARVESAATEARNRQSLQEAESEARRLVAEARAAAAAATQSIQTRAQQESQAMVDAARREIESATRQARQTLRVETADLAVSLATKVIGETLDAARHRDLVDRLLKLKET